MIPHKNVFVMAAAFISIFLLVIVRHHPPSRRKIKQIWHGHVYWDSNTTMLRTNIIRPTLNVSEPTTNVPCKNIRVETEQLPYSEKYTLITGTGRAGTTFMVELFTFLKMPTGFNNKDTDQTQKTRAKAGLERGNWSPGIEIIKTPYAILRTNIMNFIKNKKLKWIVVPLRKGEDVAKSRDAMGHGQNGGYWAGAKNKHEMKIINDDLLSNLFYLCAEHNIEIITVAFPRDVNDADYMYTRLEPIFKHYRINKDSFVNAHKIIANPSFVHSFG